MSVRMAKLDIPLVFVPLAYGRKFGEDRATRSRVRIKSGVALMVDLDAIKITPRDEEGLRLLAQGCSNKQIAGSTLAHTRSNSTYARSFSGLV